MTDTAHGPSHSAGSPTVCFLTCPCVVVSNTPKPTQQCPLRERAQGPTVLQMAHMPFP